MKSNRTLPKYWRRAVLAIAAASTIAACTSTKHDEAASNHSHTTVVEPVEVSPPAKPHGSHDPAHGGLVLMDAQYHVEIVLDTKAGRHRVFVSDNVRAALPASTFNEITLTVAGEELAMTRLGDDSAWEATGKPAPTAGAKVSIAYFKGGQPVAKFDDLPIEYVLTGKMPTVETETAVKATPEVPHGKPGHHH
ncbi:MAG: hypothetical protein KA297_00300 [Kofleriaceae bacterium]|nr:hypothetical protein [Kofleriaceae bacterium]